MVTNRGHGRRDGQHQGHQQAEQPVAGESPHGVKRPRKPMKAQVFRGPEQTCNPGPAHRFTGIDTWSKYGP